MTILVAPLVLGAMGFALGVGLSVASRRFAVPVDPRVEALVGVLPGANCAACGFTGCAAFARAVVDGKGKPAGCTAGGPDVAVKIAEIMGVEAGTVASFVAFIHCGGDLSAKRRKGAYRGIESCAAANLTAGGPFQCAYGCLGFNDCVRACPFDAIKPRPEASPVVDEEKCTGCGLCVAACPKGIISLIPKDAKLVVACSSLDKGRITRQVCEIGCIACGICAKKIPGGFLAVANNVARIDYGVLAGSDPAAITDEILKVCPTKCLHLKN